MKLKLFLVTFLFVLFEFCDYNVYSQGRQLPLTINCRQAIITRSYVLQIQNNSSEKLNLCLQAKGKTSQFSIAAGKSENFGWVQGYHFDANNLFRIWGDGYDTIKYKMPNTELSPWRIRFPDDGGLAISLSQIFVQEQIDKHVKLPIQLNTNKIIGIYLNQVPQIIFIEGSDRRLVNFRTRVNDGRLEAVIF